MLKSPHAVPPGSPIIESREDVVSEGNETELTCTAIGSKPVASIRWMKGEEELTGQWNNSDFAVSRGDLPATADASAVREPGHHGERGEQEEGVFSPSCLPACRHACINQP